MFKNSFGMIIVVCLVTGLALSISINLVNASELLAGPDNAIQPPSAPLPVGPFVEQNRSTNPLRPPLPAEFNDMASGQTFQIYNDSTLAFVDIDGDGDLDVFGHGGGFADPLNEGRRLNFYRNVGTPQSPMFEEQTYTNNPLTYTIGANARPIFADMDDDNDPDLFIGGQQPKSSNYGVFYYQNIGTSTAPRFLLINGTTPLVTGVGRSPAVADVDGDGDFDLLVGWYCTSSNPDNGMYFRNTSATPSAFNLSKLVQQTGANNPFSTLGAMIEPEFVDIEQDGKVDLFGGNYNGRIDFFRNIGADAQHPVFTQALSSANPFNGIDVKTEVEGEGYNLYKGCSSPAFADIDGDSAMEGFSGETFGIYNYFENIHPTTPVSFSQRLGLVNPFGGVDVGYKAASNASEHGLSAPAFVDINDDGDLDAFIAAERGDSSSGRPAISYYENTGSAFLDRSFGATNPFGTIDPGAKSSLAFADFDGDGDYDAVTGAGFDKWPHYYINTGTPTTPAFTEASSNPFHGLGPSDAASVTPTTLDIDGDGDYDVLVGNWDGRIFLYKNIGTATNPQFEIKTTADNPFNGVDVGDFSAPTAVDLDADGDYDVMTGNFTGTLVYYKNVGTAQAPSFQHQTGANHPLGTAEVWWNSKPAFADLDRNGTPDAFVGQLTGRISYFKNTATWPNIAPQFTSMPVRTGSTGAPYLYTVRASDLNNQPLTITATSKPGWLTLATIRSGRSTLSGTPGPTAQGIHTVTLQVSDSGGLSATQTFTITIAPRRYLYLPAVLR